MITEIKVRCLLELAKTLNFTRAAENLYMTQQAISKHILSLEQDLDVILFTRSHHSVALTEECEKLVSLFRKFQDEFEECISEIQQDRHRGENRLSFGQLHWVYYDNAPHISHMRMKEWVPGFSADGEQHSPRRLLELLKTGRLDVIVLYKRLAGNLERYEYLELREVPIMLLVSKAHVPAGESAGLASFASYPLIVDEEEQEIENLSPESARRFNISPSEIVIRPNRDSVYLAVELGQGVTLGTSMSQTENRRIEKYPTGCTDQLIIMWRKGAHSHMLEKYALFLREALEACEAATAAMAIRA